MSKRWTTQPKRSVFDGEFSREKAFGPEPKKSSGVNERKAETAETKDLWKKIQDAARGY